MGAGYISEPLKRLVFRDKDGEFDVSCMRMWRLELGIEIVMGVMHEMAAPRRCGSDVRLPLFPFFYEEQV